MVEYRKLEKHKVGTCRVGTEGLKHRSKLTASRSSQINLNSEGRYCPPRNKHLLFRS